MNNNKLPAHKKVINNHQNLNNNIHKIKTSTQMMMYKKFKIKLLHIVNSSRPIRMTMMSNILISKGKFYKGN